ncbi:MAG TPA: PhnD/SsuA/transferrin family substrate-binding protein [Burkholderiales bacterium]|nr:PhnD/SsuA/transferrin family substrate-binding protein [Burkholderiales bacterium]
MTPVANARMYSVTPAAKDAWREVLAWVLARAGVAAEFVDHDPPKLLSELWARDDLGAVMMCGLPFALRPQRPTILAAPVPSPSRYTGRAVYWSDIVVRADSPARTLADTFGGRAGYTLQDSQSGYFAFRHHLVTRHPDTPAPYREIVGGLMNPRGVIRALAEGRIDVGPLDSYCHDLIRDGDPGFAGQVRILESTDPTPMPPIVATAALDGRSVERLRAAFLAVAGESSLARPRATLLLERFVVPDTAAYELQKQRALAVEAGAPDWP